MSCHRWVRPNLRYQLLIGMGPQWVFKHPRSTYVIKAVLSCPPWVNRQSLMAFEEEARLKTMETGIQHVVDHIFPVDHPNVCGLTVPWNLRVIPFKVNARKGNRFCPEQGELFEEMLP